GGPRAGPGSWPSRARISSQPRRGFDRVRSARCRSRWRNPSPPDRSRRSSRVACFRRRRGPSPSAISTPHSHGRGAFPPALWWQVRRLRLAVEMDCDARVLARGGDTPEYAELLLRVGQRRARLPLGAPALGEPISFLGRRVRRMATALPRWRWAGATAASMVAVAVIIAACEAPRPVGLRAARDASAAVETAQGPYSPSAAYLGRLAQQYHPEG